jgi:CRISPR system Cascade subunit CasB
MAKIDSTAKGAGITTEDEKGGERMSALLEQLRRIKDNRGLMADLRCGLVDGKRHRSWPALSRIRVGVDDSVKAHVAALYAMHPEETGQGNLGTTCKAIEYKRDGGAKGEDKLTPTERRFQHLLAAEAGDELFTRVTRMILMAKSHGVPVNYEKLLGDLFYWNERTRREWASEFWNAFGPKDEGAAT